MSEQELLGIVEAAAEDEVIEHEGEASLALELVAREIQRELRAGAFRLKLLNGRLNVSNVFFEVCHDFTCVVVATLVATNFTR